MVTFKLFIYIFFNLAFFIKSLTQDDKDKVTSCLLLFRHRKLQDKNNFNKMITELKKIVEHPDEKILMFGLSNCYDQITVQEAKDMYFKFNQNRYIDSLNERNKLLLKLEDFKNTDYKEYANKLEKFAPVFNEVYEDTKKEKKKVEIKQKINKWFGFMDRDLAIVIIVCLVCIVLSVIFYCYKVNKLESDFQKDMEEKYSKAKEHYTKDYKPKEQ